MHCLDHGDDMIDRSFRQDAVAEIENMAGLTAGAAQNFGHSAFYFFRRCEQGDRIEIALHRDIMTEELHKVIIGQDDFRLVLLQLAVLLKKLQLPCAVLTD